MHIILQSCDQNLANPFLVAAIRLPRLSRREGALVRQERISSGRFAQVAIQLRKPEKAEYIPPSIESRSIDRLAEIYDRGERITTCYPCQLSPTVIIHILITWWKQFIIFPVSGASCSLPTLRVLLTTWKIWPYSLPTNISVKVSNRPRGGINVRIER